MFLLFAVRDGAVNIKKKSFIKRHENSVKKETRYTSNSLGGHRGKIRGARVVKKRKRERKSMKRKERTDKQQQQKRKTR